MPLHLFLHTTHALDALLAASPSPIGRVSHPFSPPLSVLLSSSQRLRYRWEHRYLVSLEFLSTGLELAWEEVACRGRVMWRRSSLSRFWYDFCGVVILFCISAEVGYIPWVVVVVVLSVNLVLVTVIGVVGGRLSG